MIVVSYQSASQWSLAHGIQQQSHLMGLIDLFPKSASRSLVDFCVLNDNLIK
jgi:hypothetical protein